MSARYLIFELTRLREAAGLGILALGLYGSGDLVSSTPIPGSRMHSPAGGPDLDYGGYLLGEGMTREAATYLGRLHNQFPAIAAAVEAQEDKDACLQHTLEENQALKAETCRYYMPDGSYKEFSPEQVLEMRKAAARQGAADATEISSLRAQVRILKEELQQRANQIGVACLKHDLTHFLACGRCLGEAEARVKELEEAQP